MYRYLRRTMRKILPALLLMTILLTDGIFAERTFSQAPDGAQLFQACAICHYIGKGKLIGPDLYQVTQRRDREWLIRFIRNSQEVVQSGDEYAVKLFEQHNKLPMPPFAYSDEQINAVLNYIENYNNTKVTTAVISDATTEETKAADNFFTDTKDHKRQFGTTFIISLILLLASAFDLFVTKLIKARFVNVIVILISAFIITEITVVEAKNLGRQPGYEPDQPILFSHKIHAGDNQIDCKYCHITVTQSKLAGIPSVNLCMNCHTAVRNGRNTGTVEIAKIYSAIETGKPIQWIKVHNLPDHSYFNHAQHVVTGKVQCESCHGDVKTMDRIRQMQPLSMGWCIDCHRKTQVQFTENGYYQKFVKLHEELKSGKRTRITVEDVGGTECSKCHY
ncbi:MAG: c-type cytochrome [Bacteroidales bacterium]|nr:c-type cytochrome [Bacteroidales bacterium]